jgi:hypothetical protein
MEPVCEPGVLVKEPVEMGCLREVNEDRLEANSSRFLFNRLARMG